MFDEKLKELLQLLNEVKEYINTNRENLLEEYDGEFYMKEPSEVTDKLDEWLCGNFISNSGSYTTLWYQMKTVSSKYDFKLFTGEEDSFGPLTSCISYDGWTYVFG